MPNNPLDKCHLELKNLGIKRNQVRELKFLCNETFGSDRYFMHFRTNSNDLIETAFTGDQSRLSPVTIKSGFYPLERPSGWDKFHNRLDKTKIRTIDSTGKSKVGGLAISPFGSRKISSFWTVVGDDPRNPIYECGSYHRSILDSLGQNNPAMAKTYHSVMFRGKAPSAEEVRKRMLSKINKRAFTGN